MGSVHPLHAFFQCCDWRGALFTAFWGKTLLVLTTLPVTVRAPFLAPRSPCIFPTGPCANSTQWEMGQLCRSLLQTICLLLSL